MMVGKTEITLTTGEEIPNLPDSGCRPIVVVTQHDSNEHIYQDRAGRFVQTDNTGSLFTKLRLKLTEDEREAMRCMFLRYNSHVAGTMDRSMGRRWVRFPGDTISVGLVACSAKKRDVPAKTKDMYLGQLFKFSRQWAEHFCDDWAILSAKHGLILPDEVIEPYDKVLTTKDNEIRLWASHVSFKAYMQWGEDTHFYLLCGAGYRKPFEEFNMRRHASTAPLQGLAIGQQMSWLKNQLEGAPALPQEEGKPARRRLRLRAPAKAKR